MRIERDWKAEEPNVQPTTPVVGQVSEPNVPPLIRGGGRSGQVLREWTGADVAAMEFGDIEFLTFVDVPCIVKGTATLISSFPKVGKTTGARLSLPRWRREGHSVIYFTEESDRTWHERLKDASPEWADVRFIETLHRSPAELVARMNRATEDIVVVDTARHCFGVLQENDNGEVARKAAPWIAGAREAGKTLIVLVHDNKAGGDHGRSISGGHALLGAFDAALVIDRVNGAPMRRSVKGWARLFQVPEFLYEMREDGSLVSIGDAAAVELAEVTARAADVLTEDLRSRKEIMADLDEPRPSFEQLRRALSDLVREGVAQRDPAEDRKGATYKWRAAQPHLQPPLSKGGRSGSTDAGSES